MPSPDQGALFATPAEADGAMPNHVYVRNDARPTSVIAAQRTLPRSGTQRARVLMAIQRAGRIGKTDEEIGGFLGLDGNSVRPRRKELEEDGLIVDSGRTRQTATGSPAIVWVTPEHAERVSS